MHFIAPLILFTPFTFFSGIAFLPSFLIFRQLTLLLEKLRVRNFINLAQQPEVRKLRVLLILQFVLNLIGQIWLSRPATPSTEMGISDDLAKYFQIIDKAWAYQEYAGWLTISMENAMPLVYTLLLYVAVCLNQESVRMRSELDEVV